MPYQQRLKYGQLFRNINLLGVLRQRLGSLSGSQTRKAADVCVAQSAQLEWGGSSQRRGEMLRSLLPCPQLLSLSLFPSASFPLLSWNWNSKWLRHGQFTVIISTSFFFFSLTLPQFTLPVSLGRKRNAVFVWKVDGEVVAFALQKARYYLAQCAWRSQRSRGL